MKKVLFSMILLIMGVITSCANGASSHPESKEIEVTNGETTENCEIDYSIYESKEKYAAECDFGTYFFAVIRDTRPTALTGSFYYWLIIRGKNFPHDIKEGEDLTNSDIEYYNYIGGGRGRTYSKKGTVKVLKKSDDKITLTFDNFNFTTTPCGEEFGLDGTITYKLEE